MLAASFDVSNDITSLLYILTLLRKEQRKKHGVFGQSSASLFTKHEQNLDRLQNPFILQKWSRMVEMESTWEEVRIGSNLKNHRWKDKQDNLSSNSCLRTELRNDDITAAAGRTRTYRQVSTHLC